MAVGLYEVWNSRREAKSERNQGLLAGEWTDTAVQQVIANKDDLVGAVKALRAADPRLGLVTAATLVRRARGDKHA
ncbi:hypothetical protein [Mycobacteroides abscessus]|uniref:hypothetical protein n=1 Tax=Mycobacteroides abscessus TaxID=36809 RepID=UPI00105637B7|nr:hypothetical protein [Mycobacteroides abscessus]